VDDKAQFYWYIERNGAEGAALPGALAEAVAGGRTGEWLQSLLPQNRHYRAMKASLATTKDAATRTRLRANMERWRWMPRQLGTDYVYVNVPTYQLWVVEGGKIGKVHDVIVGAKKTPTPQLYVPATDIVANPSWYIPQSIIKEEG
ncbi:L,D-transpeptidase family protein, partial [Mycolicibacterium neoaurum]|uniref:L,D-transpeptidase family protein n=1 Tax=Mycolicibacterium neoaurum TaxID=1795 RepID=UPI002671BA51